MTTTPAHGPGLDELLAAAEHGPRPWRAGLHEHLARRPHNTHGKPCCTCWAYALGYHQLGWTLTEHQHHPETHP